MDTAVSIAPKVPESAQIPIPKGDREKIAIILSGGGMKSAHGAGFLYALATKLGITDPDIMIGTSGDAGNVIYFSTGQYEGMKHIWEELLSTPKFISPLRFWRIMDIDYLVDTVFRKQEPLAIEKLGKTKVRWFISVSDFLTGRTRYIRTEDHLDIFETLRASAAIPIYFGRKVCLAGRPYIDGEIGPVLQDHIRQALSEGATRLLIINHTMPWKKIVKFVMRAAAARMPDGMEQAVIRDISTHVYAMTVPGNIEVLSVIPKNLPVGSVTRNKERIRQAVQQGIDEALALEKEIRALFFK